MTNKPPRRPNPPGPPSLSDYRPSQDRPRSQQGGSQPGSQQGGSQQGAPHQEAHQGNQHPSQRPPQQGHTPQQGHDPRLAHPHGGHPQHGHPHGQRPPHAYNTSRRHGTAFPKSPRKRFTFGKFLLYALVAVIAIVAGGLAFLVISPPTNLIKTQVIAAVKKNTGRDLTINGPTSISFYPSIGVSMSDVILSPPPGMGGPPMAKIADLTVAVRVLPLLSSEVVVDTLIMTKPQFDLRIDSKGRKSWDFASTTPRRHRVRVAQLKIAQAGATDAIPDEARVFLENATDKRAAKKVNIAALDQLRLGDVRVIDGTILYTDVPQKVTERVDALNVSVDLKSIGEPLKAVGNLTWKGEKIDFDSTLTSVKKIMLEHPAKLDTKFKTRRVSAAYDGTIATANGLVLDGALNAQSDSMRLLAKWLGIELPEVEGFGPLSIQGRLKAKGNAFSIINAKIGLDGATATGRATLTTGGVRPHINAKLKLSELDLNKYMAKEGGAGNGASPGATSSGASGAAAPGQAAPVGATQPQVRGYTKRDGWSDEHIDLASLGAVDADADLTVGRLLYGDIKVDRSRLAVKLNNKVLKADLTEMQLYKGTGRGIVTLDAKAPAASKVTANFAVNNVAVQPLLTDAAQVDWLSGTGRLTLALRTQGGSQLQFVEALGGVVTLNFIDGAISGFNLPQIIRGVSKGQLNGLNQSAAEKTDFSDLAATFNIAQGVATNTDLNLASPLLRVTGAGKIFLPAQTVDYTIKPKLVAELEGQGGNLDLSGLVVPVRIHGPFANLKYTPDVGSILADPDQAAGTIKKIGDQFKKFKGKKPSEILDGILGGLNGGQQGAQTDGAEGADGAQGNSAVDDGAGDDGSDDGGGGGGGGFDTKKAKKLLEGLFGN